MPTPLPLERPVGIAVVGLGYWGPNLVRNLHEIDLADVRAICDRRPEQLTAVGRRYPAVAATTDFDQVLADETVEAVAIATPVATHAELATRALDAGKHVFIEKPLAASFDEATALIDLAQSRGLVVMPGHTFLYSPPVVAIRRLIASGELGSIYFVSTSRVNLGLHQPDVSVAWDLAPHDFSILWYWLQETPTHVAALSRSCILPDTPDVAFINMEYSSETVAHVELSWLAPSKLRRTTIVGSEKMVLYDDTSSEPVRVFDSGVLQKNPETFGEYQLTYRTGDILSPRIDVAEPLAAELTDFCTAVRDGSTPRSSSAVGLEVIRMIEAVDRSLEQSGTRVEVEVGAPAAA